MDHYILINGIKSPWIQGSPFKSQSNPVMKTILSFFLYTLLLICLCACSGGDEQKASLLHISAPEKSTEEICLSPEEEKLFRQINAYRKSKKLKEIPYSASLSKVAQLHAKDLVVNRPHERDGCNLHSWSSKGKWSSCCYTQDHKKSSCMWDKPRELTSYKGNGYEISSYYSGAITAEQALSSWKGSPAHHDVILSRSIWKNAPWNAMGVGIYKGYAMVWFGNEADADNKIVKCK